MKPCWEVDSNGNIIEHYMWEDDAIASAKQAGKIIVDFPWPETQTFVQPKYDATTNTWVEGLTADQLLAVAKQNKINELDLACNNAILQDFQYTYSDGVTYNFANDPLAQGNFDKVLNAFNQNMMTSIEWTAYDANNNPVRLTFDATSYPALYKAHLNHIQSNISKFRDTLSPQVEGATTIDAVNQVKWS